MEITYSTGPRYIDGINVDADIDSSVNIKETKVQISDPVTGLTGPGYQPGQKNKDGSDL